MKLNRKQIAALLLLSEPSSYEELCEDIQAALHDLIREGLVDYIKPLVDETDAYILVTGGFYQLTRKGEELLRRLREND